MTEKTRLLREEAARNEATARYLLAVAKIQRDTAAYVDKQFSRGDLDLCAGALEGMVKLIARPAEAIEMSGLR